jgi:hypothetical protein
VKVFDTTYFFAAHTDEIDEQTCLKEGASRYLVKAGEHLGSDTLSKVCAELLRDKMRRHGTGGLEEFFSKEQIKFLCERLANQWIAIINRDVASRASCCGVEVENWTLIPRPHREEVQQMLWQNPDLRW